jgi:hypothetical protein
LEEMVEVADFLEDVGPFGMIAGGQVLELHDDVLVGDVWNAKSVLEEALHVVVVCVQPGRNIEGLERPFRGEAVGSLPQTFLWAGSLV